MLLYGREVAEFCKYLLLGVFLHPVLINQSVRNEPIKTFHTVMFTLISFLLFMNVADSF